MTSAHIEVAKSFSDSGAAIKQHSITIYRRQISTHTWKMIPSATYVLRQYRKDGTYTNCDGSVVFQLSDFGFTNEDTFSIAFNEFLDAIDEAAIPSTTSTPSPLQGQT